MIFTIKNHLVPIDKLNKIYSYREIKFIRNQRGEKVIPAEHEMTLTISLLELTIKVHIVEQQGLSKNSILIIL